MSSGTVPWHWVDDVERDANREAAWDKIWWCGPSHHDTCYHVVWQEMALKGELRDATRDFLKNSTLFRSQSSLLTVTLTATLALSVCLSRPPLLRNGAFSLRLSLLRLLQCSLPSSTVPFT